MMAGTMFHIVGAGRGGTSLLAGLLDYHSRISVGFEQYAAAYLLGKGLDGGAAIPIDTRVAAYVEACNRLARHSAKAIWANKITTEQLFGLHAGGDASAGVGSTLDAFFGTALERQRVVSILRDGRTCVMSKVRRTGQSIETACDRWRYSVACHRFFQESYDNSLCLRFEDLLRDPESTLTEICRFIGVAYEPTMLAGTGNEKMLPAYRRDGFDLSALQADDFPPACLPLIERDLISLGYL